jgi:DNA-directed RNA polymerase subunit K/omega
MVMSDVEIQEGDHLVEESRVPREPAAPIESRFLFVDVAALRAKQLRRGAKLRLPEPTTEAEIGPRPVKAERLAMSEVRHGLVEWSLPDFKAVFDTR